jgi:hypothetical protein
MKFSEFTFCTFSYNQEEIILDHLESIKYQINKFAKGININFVYSDDCSNDQTFNVVESWIKLNNHLFKSYKLIQQEHNVGVLKNYLAVLREVKTNHFKVLAGDDLYGPVNIFKAIRRNKIVFTPVMILNNKGINFLMKYPYRFIYNHSSKSFQERLIKSSMIQAPGVFFSDIRILDSKYFEYMAQFEYYEDFTSWFYFFILNSFKYKFSWKPFVIYRIDYQKKYNLVKDRNKIRVTKDFYKINQLYTNTKLSNYKNSWFKIMISPQLIIFIFLYYVTSIFYKKIFYKHYKIIQAMR